MAYFRFLFDNAEVPEPAGFVRVDPPGVNFSPVTEGWALASLVISASSSAQHDEELISWTLAARAPALF